MKTDVFPLNYFKSIWSPTKSFKNRHQLNWFHILIVLLFVNSLLMIPVSLNYMEMDTYPVEGTLPNSFGLIDESDVLSLQEGTYENGTLDLPSSFVRTSDKGTVAGLLSDAEMEQALDAENALIFQKDSVIIKEGDQTVSTVPYTKDFDLSKVVNVNDVKDSLSRQWFIKNRGYVVATLLFLVFSLTFVSTIFLTFGSAVFLYLTKKSDYSSIKTYKESVNFISNCMGLPTLIALVIGLIQFDIVVMLMIQSVGLVVMLLLAFYRTRYNDEAKKFKVKKSQEVRVHD